MSTSANFNASYDQTVDAFYLHLSEGHILGSEEVISNVVFDFDDKGRIVGIEVLNASKLLEASVLAQAGPPE